MERHNHHLAQTTRLFGRGQTPLFKAAFYGHVSVVEQLLKSGASVEARDSFGRGLS